MECSDSSGTVSSTRPPRRPHPALRAAGQGLQRAHRRTTVTRTSPTAPTSPSPSLTKKVDRPKQVRVLRAQQADHERIRRTTSPSVRGDVCVIHNGIVVNHELLWDEIDQQRELEIDTEIIAAIAERTSSRADQVEDLPAACAGASARGSSRVRSRCRASGSCCSSQQRQPLSRRQAQGPCVRVRELPVGADRLRGRPPGEERSSSLDIPSSTT